uniref:Uncharacterized protein n=6 Tax=Burkholderiaceae TaxID=119060 RepID=A0A2Z6ITX9_9BURK|nr:hypothetical protein [Burkholderia sp. TGCL-27]CDS90713.1 hypothetical protein [Cupriavidus sp. TGCL-2]CDS90787.1 hypothetical protein [Cupriavidus sp. TGCL-3]CDS90883.1 hypothetical protein [Cupriavidus sp. STW8_7]CDS90982.1 hypothetical protein [Cupriavidus sp. STW8_10]CDS91140.1 hypothetical protein [Cupriavidus sp. TGCL-26]
MNQSLADHARTKAEHDALLTPRGLRRLN